LPLPYTFSKIAGHVNFHQANQDAVIEQVLNNVGEAMEIALELEETTDLELET
jgi:hypothetical protein